MPKMNRRLDGITTFRQRTPTNEQTASKFTNMVQDFSQQAAVVPSKVTGGNSESCITMNAGGVPMALHAIVGGAPNKGGDPLDGTPDKPGSIRS